MTMFRALSSRNYRLYWSGQFCSQIGYWLQITALTALVYRLTNSELLLGAVAFCTFIPILPLSTFAGALIDGIDKRILRNGAPGAANVNWTQFPALTPGENNIVCADAVTVEFYPTFL